MGRGFGVQGIFQSIIWSGYKKNIIVIDMVLVYVEKYEIR